MYSAWEMHLVSACGLRQAYCLQAAACADAGASLISPFVGRIMDWYKKKAGREFASHEVLCLPHLY